MNIHNNKGQANIEVLYGVIGVVMTLIALGVILAVSQKSMATIRDTAAENQVAFKPNQTLTWAGNNTEIYLQEDELVDGTFTLYNNGTIVKQGATDGQGNYTMNLTRSSITIHNRSGASGLLLANASWVTNALNFSYNFRIGSSERNITLKGQESIDQISQWQPTWGIIIAFFVLISLIGGMAFIVWRKYS